MERPGPLFVYENTVEHTSWGPTVAAKNLRRINKEKAFTPLGLKKRLHGMTDLTGSISEKWGRGIFCPRQVLFAKRVPEKRKVKAPVAVSPEQIVH